MRKIIILSAMALLTAACGGGDGSDTTQPGAVQGDFEVITVTEIAYPAEVTIPAGKDVKFENESGLSHTITFEEMDGAPFDLRFDLGNGGSVGFPLEPGEYVYFCEFHPSMRGTLQVEG